MFPARTKIFLPQNSPDRFFKRKNQHLPGFFYKFPALSVVVGSTANNYILCLGRIGGTGGAKRQKKGIDGGAVEVYSSDYKLLVSSNSDM
jgi:hypothetical protein